MSRRILQKIEKTSEEKFMKKKKIKDWMKKIVAVYYYHDYSLPVEEFQSLVRGSKVDYIISTTRELDEYLSGDDYVCTWTDRKLPCLESSIK